MVGRSTERTMKKLGICTIGDLAGAESSILETYLGKMGLVLHTFANGWDETPVSVAVDEADQGYLGIQGQNIDETAASMYGMPRGIYVYKIVEDSAASKSDLREKDIITKFDGQTVRTMADLKDMLTYYKGGDTVNLTVQSLEDGQYVERAVQITLGTKPAGETN